MDIIIAFYNRILISSIFWELLLSGFLLFTTILCYAVSIKIITGKTQWSIDKKQRKRVFFRNLWGGIFLLGIVFIWAGQIKPALFSITALFAALLIGLKEIWLSVISSFIISATKVFDIGDYVEIDNNRGKIIDKSWLYTKVMLANTYHTEEIVIPNANFLTHKFNNLSRLNRLQHYHISIGVSELDEIQPIAAKLLAVGNEVLAPYVTNYNKSLVRNSDYKMFFELPNMEPTISYDLADPKKRVVILNYLCHPAEHNNMEKTLYDKFLTIKSQPE